jgi:hypothetical protein
LSPEASVGSRMGLARGKITLAREKIMLAREKSKIAEASEGMRPRIGWVGARGGGGGGMIPLF